MVSSGAAEGGIGGWGAYSASKAAMNSLARFVFSLPSPFGVSRKLITME